MIPTRQAAQLELARRHFPDFARAVWPGFAPAPFHVGYYGVLQAFARGTLRRLMVTMPPQHGKSLAASVWLPAYLLGLEPRLRIVIASYALSHAVRFNRQVQRLMSEPAYAAVFPDTRLKRSPTAERGYIRTADEFETVGYGGGLLSVGREGALTGNTVDVLILDDLYKDMMEANSPLIRENVWEWYVSVARSRLHNRSRELMVMTRWHADDLIGRIGKREAIRPLTDLRDVGRFGDDWARLGFEALKEGAPFPLDPRGPGEALWEERQSAALLREKRTLDPATFSALYQGDPCTREGLLYGEGFRTYDTLPPDTVKKGNYTDTADTGDDYLCSVCYEVGRDGAIYVTDTVYTREGMEYTEGAVAEMLERNGTRIALVESNNGGRGFARNVARLTTLARVEWFHQGANKEARILTNRTTVLEHVRMPADWNLRWPEFHAHVTAYRRTFRANRWHDAADVLTGIVEREKVHPRRKTIRKIGFL